MPKRAPTAELTTLASIGEVPAADWDRLVPGGAEGNPFVSHAFLSALEDSGSASVRTGWQPLHLALRDGGRLIGALPCYAKSHSQGEYVFDHGWANAFERAGGRYYPKLQCSVPFTPATGPRLLTGGDEPAVRRALLEGAELLAARNELSSVHVTFMPEDEWTSAGEAGWLQRTDQQYHWFNDGYAGFDEFLAALSSRKRKAIRKEREAALAGIEIDRLTGRDLTEAVWDRFFQFYMDTGSRKWGRPYLNRKFYSLIGERMADRIVLVMARRGQTYIAGAINFVGDGCLFGRHWGCVEERPFLHFEVCYYQAIEHAIAHGLGRVEAGAQGQHKLARGYVPVTVRSAHWIGHPGLRGAIERFLEEERQEVAEAGEFLSSHAPYRRGERTDRDARDTEEPS